MVCSQNNMHTYLHSVKCEISTKYLLSRLHEYSCLIFVVPTSYSHKPTYFRTFFKLQYIYHFIFLTEAIIRMWCCVYKIIYIIYINYIFLYRRKHFLQFLISPDLSSRWGYLFITDPTEWKSLGSLVGISIGYGLDGRGVWVRVLVESRFFSSPYRLDQLWGRPRLLSNGYRGAFSMGEAAGAWSWLLISN
jgi:hypothetical protein